MDTPHRDPLKQLGAKGYVRDQGFKLNENGELFDMSDALFAGKTTTDATAQTKLQPEPERHDRQGKG